jgi:hypothetical protein
MAYIRGEAREQTTMFPVTLDELIPADHIWRVAQAFDLAGDTKTVGAPFLRVFCEGRESGMPAPSGFHHVPTTKSNSTRSIAAHPCEKRKDGAPSVGMVHAKIVKGGPPPCATFRVLERWTPRTSSYSFIRHRRRESAGRLRYCPPSPDAIVGGTHPSKIAKGGAASVVVAPPDF